MIIEDFKINNVLMPTDFTELTSGSFELVLAICKRHNAKLTLLHIIDNMAYMYTDNILEPSYNIAPEIINTFRERIEDLAQNLTLKTGVSVEGKIELGNPEYTLGIMSYEFKYDLIVMASQGTIGFREYFISSRAIRIVKNVNCPILVIPLNWNRIDFKKIIYPVWLFNDSLDKFEYSRAIIQKNASKLVIVGLAEQKHPHSFVDLINLVEKLELQMNNDHVEYTSIMYHTKKFHEKVIECADENDADLIVIAGDPDYDREDIIVGPFTQRIVNRAKRPLLIIPSVIIDKKQASGYTLKDVLEQYYN